MRPLRVLFISHGWGLGGAERGMLETIEALDRPDFEPSVVVPREGQLETAARRLGAWTHVFRAPWWLPPLRYSSRDHFRVYLEGLPGFVEPIARIIRERRIDLVYSCSGPIIHGGLAALVTRTAHVHHMQDLLGWPHLDLRMPFGSARVAYGIMGRLASLVVCLSRTIREDIGTAIAREKCRIVLPGFRMDRNGSAPLELPGPEAPVRVGILGSVEPRKGSEMVAALVRRVCSVAPQVHFYWAGPGPRERMEAIAAEAQVDGMCHIHFLGYQADVQRFLKAVDFVLHPARNESFGRILVEAAMMERAAVTTDCGGTREIVQDGVTGFLAPVDDVEALSRAIVQLAVQADLRQRMGLAARRVAETFELGRFQDGMREALIDAHSRGPVLRYRAGSAAIRKLLQIPSIAMPALRALGIQKVVRMARRWTGEA